MSEGRKSFYISLRSTSTVLTVTRLTNKADCFSLNIGRLEKCLRCNKRSVKTRRRRSFLPQTAMGINSCQEKEKKGEKKSCQDMVIPSSPNASLHPSILHPSILHPFIPVPNSHQTSCWLTAVPARPRCLRKNIHTHIYTHTHASIWSDAVTPRQRCPSCVLLRSDRLVLACERAQGFRGQSCAAASAPRCGLALTCLVERKAERTVMHVCARWS